MTKAFFFLFKIEFFRIWTISRIIILGLMFVLGIGLAFLINSSGLIDAKTDSYFSEFSYSSILPYFFTFIIPVVAFFFSAGIISYDINNHWLSSILSRSVTKTDFFASKVLSVTLSLLFFMIIPVLIPLLIFDFISNVTLKVDFLAIFYSIFAYLLEGMLFIVIASFFSTFLSNFKNAFLLGIWILADYLQRQIIPTVYWDNHFILILSDFFFPNGFSESVKTISSTGKLNYESILWGISAISAFISLSIYRLNKIKIDKSSE